MGQHLPLVAATPASGCEKVSDLPSLWAWHYVELTGGGLTAITMAAAVVAGLAQADDTLRMRLEDGWRSLAVGRGRADVQVPELSTANQRDPHAFSRALMQADLQQRFARRWR